MDKDYWIVWVNYPFIGTDDMVAMDTKLEALLGGRSGSGAGMGERDIDWEYDKEIDAKAALAKLKAASLNNDVEMGINHYGADDED